MWRRPLRHWALALLLAALCVAGSEALVPTGLDLPPLDIQAPHYGGAWAASTSLVFLDLMKHSTPFDPAARGKGSTGNWGYSGREPFPMRPDGYPANFSVPNYWTELSVVAKIGDQAAYYPAGKYVLLYDGIGTVVLSDDAVVTASRPGRLELTLTPAVGFKVRITNTNSSDPLRYIRIVPAEYEQTYEQQPFHPRFLEQVSGFKLLRFTAWQRVTGDERNPSMLPRSWDNRTTPTTHTQSGRYSSFYNSPAVGSWGPQPDGVAVEHMVALCNKVKADAWFSMPNPANDSDPYITNFASYVAANLDPSLKVYLEWGASAPGWMSLTQATNTIRMGRVWRAAWAAAGADVGRTVVVANTDNYQGKDSIPYIFQNFDSDQVKALFGGVGLSGIDAVALSGAYGTGASHQSGSCHYKFNENFFPQNNPNLTLSGVTTLARQAQLQADVVYNRWFNRLAQKGLRLLAMGGGPDRSMVAPEYSARRNYENALNAKCASYPCSLGMWDPWPGQKAVWASEAEKNASYPAAFAQGQNEYRLDELLRQVKLDVADTKEHVLDSLWRWEQMGGGEFVFSLPQPRRCDGAPAWRYFTPTECLTGTAKKATYAYPADSPIYQAVRAYQAGGRSKLARNSEEATKAPAKACDPACEWGTCVQGKCVCYAGVSGATCSKLGATKPNDCNKVLGINLEGIADYSRSWTFLDVMKIGRQWFAHNFEYSWADLVAFNDSKLDAAGYPKALDIINAKGQRTVAGTLIARDLQGHFPSGTYTVLYDGEGVVGLGMELVNARYVEAGRIDADYKLTTQFNNGIWLTIERTNPANPIRNIRLLMPGVGAAAADDVAVRPFHPKLLDFVKGYNAIRFMDWMHTNSDKLPTTWGTRSKPGDRSFAANKGGVPIEYMVQLCNEVGASPWFNMPHTADDDYIARFAQLVGSLLRPDVKVYVEWSNEVWHTGFPGGQFAQSEGVRLGYNEEGAKYYLGATSEARLCYYAERTKRMSQAWRDVFGDRVVVVAEGQGVLPITSSKVLTCRNSTAFIDALAVGPYFGSFDAGRDTSLDKFMNTTLPKQLNETFDLVRQHAAVATKYGKKLMAYESGQGIGGSDDQNSIPFKAQRDPRMAGIYQRYMEGLAAANTSQVMHYSSVGAWSRYGFWGLMEWMDQDPTTAYKLKGLEAYVESLAGGPGTCSLTPTVPTNGSLDYIEHYECGYQCTFQQGVCNKTTAIDGRDRYWGCTCKPQFWGLECSLFGCPNNCNYAGSCVDTGVCNCFPGYAGAACEIDCGCNGRGTCKPDNTCACDAGWRAGPSGCEWDCSCADGSACIGPGECGCNAGAGCKYGTCYHGRCECWAGYSGAACDVPAPAGAPNTNSSVGVNVGGINYWITEWVFVDVMKQSSSWFTGNMPDTNRTHQYMFDTGDPLVLDSAGWPTSLPKNKFAHKLTLRNVQLRTMPGRYVALYDGDGTLDFQFDSKIVSVAKGRVEFELTPTSNPECAATGAAYCGDNGLSVRITGSNPANPLRNLRLLMPGFEHTAERQPFHPWFLKSMERYSVIRFMPWMDLGGEQAPTWDTRTTPRHDTQSRVTGVALEHIVALCNQLGAAPWITVHHLADDAYVAKMAQFLKANLRPDLKVYVEHSNEVWNPGFASGKYAAQRGLELGLSTDQNVARWRYHGLRSHQIFDIFTSAFGAQARAARLRYVVGTWGFACGTGCGMQATPETLSVQVGGASLASKADLLAVTGYFGCDLGASATADKLLTHEQMVAQCQNTTKLAALRSDLQRFKDLAARFGLALTTYEAGPSIVEYSAIHNGGVTPGAAARYFALQRDPRFEGIFRQYLDMFDDLGLVSTTSPLMQFISTGLPSQYGFWGLQEYTGQPASEAPKYRALMGKLEDKRGGPVNTPGCMSPDLGYRAVGDGSYVGLPAVMSPAKGAVWVQGYQYNVTFPAAHTPVGPLQIAIYQTTNCGADAVPLHTFPSATPSLNAAGGWVTVTAPATIDASDLFLQITGPSGQKNFSELFSIQPKYGPVYTGWSACNATCTPASTDATATGTQTRTVCGCMANPALPLTPALPALRPFCQALPMNLTNVGIGDNSCMIDAASGCRTYRTNSRGLWYSSFKPITDCTAQYPARPGTDALAALGLQLADPRPGAAVDASFCATDGAALTQRVCTVTCVTS